MKPKRGGGRGKEEKSVKGGGKRGREGREEKRGWEERLGRGGREER